MEKCVALSKNCTFYKTFINEQIEFFAGCPKQVNNVTGAVQCSASYFTINKTNIFLEETQAVLCQN